MRQQMSASLGRAWLLSPAPLLSPDAAARPLLLLLLLLALQSAAHAGPWDLSTFRLCRTFKLEEIKENTSGVTYMPDRGTIWVVVNNPPGLYEYTLGARLLRQLDMSWLADPEDVAYVSADRLAVLEEPPWGGIRVFDVSEGGGGRQTEYVAVTNPRSAGFGNEGLAYDPRNTTFYVAQEAAPKRIIAVWACTGNHDAEGWSQVVDGDACCSMAGDFAGLYFAADQHQFFILSQESSRIMRLTLDRLVVVQELGVQMTQPEGITFTPDGRTMVLVGEPNEMVVYQADDCGDGLTGSGG